MTKKLMYLVNFALLVVIVFAGGTSVSQEFKDDDWEQNRIIDDSHLTVLGLISSKNTFEDLESLLGKAILIRPDKTEHDLAACYISNNPGDETVIIFRKNGRRIGGFKLIASEATLSGRSECKKSNLVTRNIATASGLKLGMSRKSLLSIMGPPTKQKEAALFYLYQTKKRMTEKEIESAIKAFGKQKDEDYYFDILTYMKAYFSNSQLVVLDVGKTVSY